MDNNPLIGQLALTIRFALYPVAGWLIGNGIIGDGTSEAFVSSVAEVIAGAAVYIATIVWSRVASAKGGVT